MNIIKNVAWGIITARGGSKSIPLKNIIPVCGQPLVAYTINAALKAKTVSRVICSTDSDKIAKVSKLYGAEVLERPEELAGDLARSLDVMINVAETLEEHEGGVAEILILFQPTSIFITSNHIDACVNALLNNPDAKSSQTVVQVPHQYHAHNQRQMFDDGKDIAFVYEKERKIGYSKQTKPVYYTCANLIVARTDPMIKDKTLFGRPSIPIEIPRYYSYDLDTADDLEMAELMIKNKLVNLE